MINFCPDCGLELEKEYKFCPNCGRDLENIKEDIPAQKEIKQVIICDNCGEESPADKEFCRGCGAVLTGEKIQKELPPTKVQKPHKPDRIEKKVTTTKKNIKPQARSNAKTLEGQKILLVIAGGIIVVFLVLILSGMFDSAPTPTTQTMPQGQQQIESGVNLANMNKINELQTIVDNNPDDLKTLLELAHLKNDSGLFERAIEDYQKYLAKDPTNPDARIDMGVCYYNLGQYDKAIAEMNKALEYQPAHQIGHLNLGIVNLAAGNIQASKEWLQKAVNINPTSEIGKRAKELLETH